MKKKILYVSVLILTSLLASILGYVLHSLFALLFFVFLLSIIGTIAFPIRHDLVTLCVGLPSIVGTVLQPSPFMPIMVVIFLGVAYIGAAIGRDIKKKEAPTKNDKGTDEKNVCYILSMTCYITAYLAIIFGYCWRLGDWENNYNSSMVLYSVSAIMMMLYFVLSIFVPKDKWRSYILALLFFVPWHLAYGSSAIMLFFREKNLSEGRLYDAFDSSLYMLLVLCVLSLIIVAGRFVVYGICFCRQKPEAPAKGD